MKTLIYRGVLVAVILCGAVSQVRAQSGSAVFSKTLGPKILEVFFDAPGDTLVAKVTDGGTAVTIDLPTLTQSFADAVQFGTRIWLISSNRSAPIVHVLESGPSPGLLDTVFAHLLSISPDARFMAFTRWTPRNDVDDSGAVYLIYDITRTADQNRMVSGGQSLTRHQNGGLAVFPLWNRQTQSYSGRESDQGAVHLAKSPLLWIEPNSFAFLHQSSSNIEAVLISVSSGGGTVLTVPINIEPLVGPSTPGPGALATAGLVAAKASTLLTAGPSLVRVRFILADGLMLPYVDVEWPR